MTQSPIQRHSHQQIDKKLLKLFDLYRQDIISTHEYTGRILSLTASYPSKTAKMTVPTHLSNEAMKGFSTHHRAIILIQEMNGYDHATEYCRTHGLTIRLCASCGLTPTYLDTCLACSQLLPDHANETSTDHEVER